MMFGFFVGHLTIIPVKFHQNLPGSESNHIVYRNFHPQPHILSCTKKGKDFISLCREPPTNSCEVSLKRADFFKRCFKYANDDDV